MTKVKFDNTDLSEFGYSFHKVIDEVPEHDYEEVTIVGKDGTLLIDNKRMNNVQESYDIAIPDNSTNKLDSLRNFLASKVGYKKLEDDIRPNHYTKARFTGFNSRVTDDRKIAVATMNFERIPQRFLKAGDTPSSVSTSSSTSTGNPVSISNPSGLTALTGLNVDIEPIQNLNGYDHPWVGGAGKNLLENTKTSATTLGVTFTVNSDGSVTANGKAEDSDVTFAIPIDTTKLHGNYYFVALTGGSVSTYNSYIWDTTAGGRAKKWDGTTASINSQDGSLQEVQLVQGHTTIFSLRVMKDATVNNVTFYPMIVASTETDASWTPYENICPITGHASATVTRTGKNLLKPPTVSTSENNGISFTYMPDGGIVCNGTSTAVAYSAPPNGFRLPVGQYVKNAQDSNGIGIFVQTKTLPNWTMVLGGGASDRIMTISADDTLYDLAVRIRIPSGITLNDYVYYPMIRLASDTDATYEPYQGQTVTVDLNGTIYGGTLDVLTGVLTVTHGFATFTGASTENWGTRTFSAGRLFENVITGMSAPQTSSPNSMTNLFKYNVNLTNNYEYRCLGVTLAIHFDDVSTVADFKTWLASNPLQVCYPLATPQTVQLTAQQVSLLTGTNIISTDMNSLTVTIASPAELENPTLFESKPLIRVYGNGTLNVNNIYITVANSPYTYIDIDCELMDCYHGSNNANQYVSFSTTDYVTLRSGMNYFSYSGFTSVQVTPRWFEI